MSSQIIFSTITNRYKLIRIIKILNEIKSGKETEFKIPCIKSLESNEFDGEIYFPFEEKIQTRVISSANCRSENSFAVTQKLLEEILNSLRFNTSLTKQELYVCK